MWCTLIVKPILLTGSPSSAVGAQQLLQSWSLCSVAVLIPFPDDGLNRFLYDVQSLG